MTSEQPTLLCVANFSANVGYAWNFIENLYARIADHLASHGIQTFVAYPAIPVPPRTLSGSAACAISLDVSLASIASIRATVNFIRHKHVQVVYFTDRPAWSLAYCLLRWAGVRHIIVHDHTSGTRARPKGLKRAAKWLLARTPGIVADVVIGVSDYVTRRHVEVGLIPRRRVVTIWNGIAAGKTNGEVYPDARGLFGLAPHRPLVVSACRASGQKGVAHLLRAFDIMAQNVGSSSRRPALVYIGDGPQMMELRLLRDSLSAKGDIILAGYRSDVALILNSADICVVPSVWQEAFGLSVLEPMACGKPVVATSVGGIPELIEHNVTGLLVPPADEALLATAMYDLITDPSRAIQLGKAGHQRVLARFSLEQQIVRLTALVEDGFKVPCKDVYGG